MCGCTHSCIKERSARRQSTSPTERKTRNGSEEALKVYPLFLSSRQRRERTDRQNITPIRILDVHSLSLLLSNYISFQPADYTTLLSGTVFRVQDSLSSFSLLPPLICLAFRHLCSETLQSCCSFLFLKVSVSRMNVESGLYTTTQDTMTHCVTSLLNKRIGE